MAPAPMCDAMRAVSSFRQGNGDARSIEHIEVRRYELAVVQPDVGDDAPILAAFEMNTANGHTPEHMCLMCGRWSPSLRWSRRASRSSLRLVSRR